MPDLSTEEMLALADRIERAKDVFEEMGLAAKAIRQLLKERENANVCPVCGRIHDCPRFPQD